MTAAGEVRPAPEVLAYAAEVRAALADVPAERSAELLDDLEEHLAEVALEGHEPLVARLGPPADYAAELRRSAGLADAVTPTRNPWRRDLAQLLDRLHASRPVVAVADFLPELRPAWWVVRAWGGLLAVDAVFLGTGSFPVPTLGLGPLIGLGLTGAAVTWSVRRGLRARANPGLGSPRVAVLVNGALAALAVVALFAVADRPDSAVAADYEGPGSSTLAHEDGTPITNIQPFSATGEPLSGVLLYDQDGRPIDNVADFTADGDQVERVPEVPPAPANAFPQAKRVLSYDEQGNPVWAPPTTVPVPSTPPSTSPSPPAAPTGTSATPTR
jgi:hypothetical protein